MNVRNKFANILKPFKTPFFKILLSFLAGIFITTILLITFFYGVLVPRYEKNLKISVQEKLDVTDNMQKHTSEVNTDNQEGNDCPICVDQIYNWDGIKEFYSIKVLHDSWIPFHSNKVGIKFEYPIEKNRLVLFEFNQWPKRESDPTGVEFSWSTRDLGMKYGNDYFAWGASKDLKIGRMSVDIYKWTEDGGNYYIHSSGGQIYQVEEIMVRDTQFGTKAMIYKNICFFLCDESDIEYENLRTLIVTLPEDHRPGIESVLFDIREEFSSVEIERLLSSIEIVD